MKTSEGIDEIVKALIKAQDEISKVGKDRKNPFANSDYATLDNILEEVKPKLNKHDIFLSQEAFTEKTENSVQVGVITKFIHSSGQFIEYEPLFMELEKGAKMNMAQSAGSVITYAKRYAISAALGISTGEDTDGNQPQVEQNKSNNDKDQKRKEEANEFYKNKKEVEERIREISKATNKPYKELLDFAINKSNEKLNANYNNINSKNIGQMVGQIKIMEMALKQREEANK